MLALQDPDNDQDHDQNNDNDMTMTDWKVNIVMSGQFYTLASIRINSKHFDFLK